MNIKHLEWAQCSWESDIAQLGSVAECPHFRIKVIRVLDLFKKPAETACQILEQRREVCITTMGNKTSLRELSETPPKERTQKG